MSLLVGVIGGASGLLLLNHHNENKRKQAEAVAKLAEGKGQREQRVNLSLHTGAYGSVAEITEILGQPGIIVKIEEDVDLSGMPCRWLYLQNGGIYKTYNMTSP